MTPSGSNHNGNKNPARIRLCSYNLRVDHSDDQNTKHEWSLRRPLVVSSILGLDADLMGVQEPSPLQARHLEHDLGTGWGVALEACDPHAWERATEESGPNDGQARDGNGFVWKTSTFALERFRTVWLNPIPNKPHPPSLKKDGSVVGAWGGSKYQRTVAVGHFKHLQTRKMVVAFSGHFDHVGSDDNFPEKQHSSQARIQSAELLMKEALFEGEKNQQHNTMVVVMGDFNTFLDRSGACYKALVDGANGKLLDVRDMGPEIDVGRQGATWEGWESNPWCRSNKGNSRLDQMFCTPNVAVHKTFVPNELFDMEWKSKMTKVYPSDHMPIVTDISF